MNQEFWSKVSEPINDNFNKYLEEALQEQKEEIRKAIRAAYLYCPSCKPKILNLPELN